MPDEPTLGEVMRQVRDLVQQVRDLVQEVRADYVRKDLYDARHEALRRQQEAAIKEVADDVAEVKKGREKDADRWKQAMFTIGVAILLLLIQGALTVSNFMARTGG